MSKFLIPLALVLGSIAMIVIFIIPGWQQFLVVRADTKHLQDIDSEIDTLTQKRDALVQEISRISKDDFQRLDQVLPPAPLGPEFLVILNQLATVHGLQVDHLDLSGTLSTKPRIAEESAGSSFAPVGVGLAEGAPKTVGASTNSSFVPVGKESAEGAYKTVGVSMELTGQYQSFKDFLRDLESYIRIIDVDTLTLTPSAAGFEFKLTVKTYYQ